MPEVIKPNNVVRQEKKDLSRVPFIQRNEGVLDVEASLRLAQLKGTLNAIAEVIVQTPHASKLKESRSSKDK